MMKKICVYCGSSPGATPDFITAARALGRLMAEKGLGLVYGGAGIGVMGALADAALEAGGEVTGVIPSSIMDREVGHRGLTRQHVVGSMHERKAMMSSLSDGFITLPGGLGTLEELFETMTWAQLGMHRKPIGLLNLNGYYDKLLEFLDQAVGHQFVREIHRTMLLVDHSPASLLDRMSEYDPPVLSKWLTMDKT